MRTLLALGSGLALAAGLAAPTAAQAPAHVPAAAVPLESYLPAGVTYDPAFPRPESVLGWTVGERHASHDQVVAWCRAVDAASERVTLETYGATHEARPLLLATITSPKNHARLEELRRAHVDAVLRGADRDDGPAVVWLGYGVHGNEPSASNAALVVLYHLAAATGPELEAFLEDTIVLLDPCLNPDGHGRFAQWANSHRGQQLVGDPKSREHNEAWPGGRTNHYWFDLNRDWLLLTHPESRGRVAAFQRWLPCVLTDYHEMGTDATYFFQPGIPSRMNPITPARNLELTRAIAAYHASALDALGRLYYTEESFDDFYYGKGSTYPDIHGCVGILFEQASSRGHYQESSFGGVTFPFTIKNQVTTSLSTLAAARALRAELSDYQRASYRTALEEAAAYEFSAYVFGAAEDPGRTHELADILRRHGVAVHTLGADVNVGGEAFVKGKAFVVPVAQPQFRLVRAAFERRTSWDDNTFYDVSSWTLPLSFGLPYGGVAPGALDPALLGPRFAGGPREAGAIPAVTEPVAWALEWTDTAAPRALAELLAAGVHTRVATEPFEAATPTGQRAFARGTLLMPRGLQTADADALRRVFGRVSALGLEVHALTSGLTGAGVDLGSSSFAALTVPRPALVVGEGVSAYEAGEAWHELDVRLGLPVSLVERGDLEGLDLARYTHLLLVAGAEAGWSEALTAKVKAWVQAGGILVATSGAARGTARAFLANEPEADAPKVNEPAQPYADYDDLRAVRRIAGAIFSVELDLTHPLTFGLTRSTLPVVRGGEAVLPAPKDPFSAPARYSAEPLLSGYASAENVARIQGTPAVRAERIGAGVVICLADDPLFRGVWYGSRRLHANALFFGGAIRRTGPISARSEAEADQVE